MKSSAIKEFIIQDKTQYITSYKPMPKGSQVLSSREEGTLHVEQGEAEDGEEEGTHGQETTSSLSLQPHLSWKVS